MPTIQVAVVRRETEAALQLVFWDDYLARHRICWAPKSLVKTKCHAGDRDLDVEVYANLASLDGWKFLEENERLEYLAFLKSQS